jgi:hypothetical protein
MLQQSAFSRFQEESNNQQPSTAVYVAPLGQAAKAGGSP